MVREIAVSYWPETPDKYPQLPRGHGRVHRLKDGKTARDKWIEHLAVLDEEMKAVVDDVMQENVDEIEIHGRFLKNRFAKSELLV